MSAVSRADSNGVWNGPSPLSTTAAEATAGTITVAAVASVKATAASAAARRRQAAAATQHTAAAATPMAAVRSQPGRPVPLAGSSQVAYPAVASTAAPSASQDQARWRCCQASTSPMLSRPATAGDSAAV